MSAERPAPDGAVAYLEHFAAWQEAAASIPFLLMAGWCDAFAAFATPHRHVHAAPAEDHQLAVPDTIEEEGERALFA
ncbi:hypothetical protein ACFQ1E_15340 [Sphingomonas canadensis]|uniref:Uncharacterized protein n=1 Tax=Sphingomonas canadensis TaxID=1219257 RepID=A0ABW3HDJ0_9SPHN|nr:hypothetical protein [Sphingomonas canadensis]MCW3837424.1 hypothetical protein [Sphingomonas canadensis]